jgi:WD40 repeat protein
MVTTSDGAYLFAGFSNGYIRVFDLTSSGNTDQEDRFGHALGKINCLSCHEGKLVLNLRLAEETPKSSYLSCSHLFAGKNINYHQIMSRLIIYDDVFLIF